MLWGGRLTHRSKSMVAWSFFKSNSSLSRYDSLSLRLHRTSRRVCHVVNAKIPRSTYFLRNTRAAWKRECLKLNMVVFGGDGVIQRELYLAIRTPTTDYRRILNWGDPLALTCILLSRLVRRLALGSFLFDCSVTTRQFCEQQFVGMKSATPLEFW